MIEILALDWSVFFWALAVAVCVIIGIEFLRAGWAFTTAGNPEVTYYDRRCFCGSDLPTFKLKDPDGTIHSYACDNCYEVVRGEATRA